MFSAQNGLPWFPNVLKNRYTSIHALYGNPTQTISLIKILIKINQLYLYCPYGFKAVGKIIKLNGYGLYAPYSRDGRTTCPQTRLSLRNGATDDVSKRRLRARLWSSGIAKQE